MNQNARRPESKGDHASLVHIIVDTLTSFFQFVGREECVCVTETLHRDIDKEMYTF